MTYTAGELVTVQFLTAVVLIECSFGALLLAAESTRRGPPEIGDVIGCLFALLFLLVTVLVVRHQSPIVIDEERISRTLFGWKWQTISWDNVRLIRVLPFNSPALKMKFRTIRICPIARPRVRLSSSGAMMFTDEAIGADKMIGLG